MNMKRLVVTAVIVGSGLAAQAYADGHGSPCVSLGYAAKQPGVRITFQLNTGNRIDSYTRHERSVSRHELNERAYAQRSHKHKHYAPRYNKHYGKDPGYCAAET